MLNFRNFLSEARDTKVMQDGPLTHLYHTSSLGHLAGPKGTEHALGALTTLHKAVAKGTLPDELSVKIDGAPSAMAKGPSANEPLGAVGTKGWHNANPKIARSHEDVDDHYGHSMGLQDKMHKFLDAVPKFVPPGMLIQGDIVHGGGKDVSVQDIDGVPHATWKSNLMKYAVPVDSDEGQKAMNSKVGFAPHTVYDEHGNARPLSKQEFAQLGQHPDVHIMNPYPSNPPVMTPDQNKLVGGHLANAKALHDTLKKEDGYATVMPHGLDLETYVNSTIRSGEKQSLGGFQKWIVDRGEREAAKVKTPAAQNRKRQEAQAVLMHIKQNARHFNNALAMQHELEKATSHLSDSMSLTHGYRGFIGDQETGPEGHVYNYRGKSVKILRRRPEEEGGVAFSQANLQKGGFGK